MHTQRAAERPGLTTANDAAARTAESLHTPSASVGLISTSELPVPHGAASAAAATREIIVGEVRSGRRHVRLSW